MLRNFVKLQRERITAIGFLTLKFSLMKQRLISKDQWKVTELPPKRVCQIWIIENGNKYR